MKGRSGATQGEKAYRPSMVAAADKETPLLSSSSSATRGRMALPPPNYSATTHSQRRLQLRRDSTKSPSKLCHQQSKRSGDGPVFKQVFTTDSPKPQHRKKTTRYVAPASPLKEEEEQLIESKPKKHHHSFLYSMLNPRSHQWQAVAYKRFITTVIISDALLFIVSTDPTMWDKHSRLFKTAEGVVSSIFLIEYVLRLYVIPESRKYAGPCGRLKYATTTAAAWIDLLATIPFFVEFTTGLDLPTLTVLRMFRLFRILKTESYVRAIDAVYRVIYYNKEILYVALLLCIFLTAFTAILLYYLRPRDDDTNFESIGATLYLSTLMLTGQGGPEGNLPWYTKLVVLITSIFSVAMFAIPSSMLTWGFEAEAARMAKRARKRALLLENKSERSTATTSTSSSSSSYYSSSDSDTTDEEYFKMIAGEGDDEDVEETPWMKQIRESFENADRDADGTLTLAEATEMIARSQAVGGRSDNAEIMARMDELEAKLNANNVKLDRILQLLMQKK